MISALLGAYASDTPDYARGRARRPENPLDRRRYPFNVT